MAPSNRTVHRALYAVVGILFVVTCYFFILDLKSQYPADITEETKQAYTDDLRQKTAAYETTNPYNSEKQSEFAKDLGVGKDRQEFTEWEKIIRKHNEKQFYLGPGGLTEDNLRKYQNERYREDLYTIPQQCYSTPSYKKVEFGIDNVRRYIDSFTYDADREAFHPKDNFLKEAEASVVEGLAQCDWASCSSLCVNASIYSSLLYLKDSRNSDAVSTLNVALQRATSHYDLSRLHVFLGFTFEYQGRLESQGYKAYTAAVNEWPESAIHYFGVIRYNLPNTAVREDKMKIYYYGRREELEALLDGLLAKEFHPNNLHSYPILHYDEPDQFWQGGVKEYKMIRQLQSPFIQATTAKMISDMIANGAMEFNDPQAKRYYAYNERWSRFFQFASVEVIRKILGRPVQISYTYFGGYVEGSTLSPHTDRPACEYTMSLCVDHFPRGDTWKLGINKNSRPDVTPTTQGGPGVIPATQDIVWADLQPGDAFIFKGREKVHWRDGELEGGAFSRVYFYHYVNEDYVGSLT